jgi:Na+-transporting NADH:ubiquinone oxidoreductase subunit NqrC
MPRGRELVALVLAVGLAAGIVIICGAVAINAVQHQEPLSDNATQVLTAAFGGIVGVLGAYLGFRAGERAERRRSGE